MENIPVLLSGPALRRIEIHQDSQELFCPADFPQLLQFGRTGSRNVHLLYRMSCQ